MKIFKQKMAGLHKNPANYQFSIVNSQLLYHLKESIRLLWIENLVAVHHCDEVFGVGEVDDVVGVAGEHVDALDVVASDFKFDDFIGAQLALLDEAVTADNDEKLPLGVVPMLTFGDTRF